MASMEDRMFAKQLSACTPGRPVFITALPRAGTTLLLELCARLPDFVSHTYRDMPFVMTPCLWHRFSSGFNQTSETRERSHGDGMMINEDSPEAFEEILWKVFWRKHYMNDRIAPWQNAENQEFLDFFRSHMQKIILLRRGDDTGTARYISKNNLNIARTAWLRQHFPDATIIVPFRKPLQHAASLLGQHQNFLGIHSEDAFASQYMRAIGHFDFGQNLKPVDFDGWLDKRSTRNTENLAFWLEYWIASYSYLLTQNHDTLKLIHYEGLCTEPDKGLNILAELIDTRHADKLLAVAPTIRAPKARNIDAAPLDTSLLTEAETLYDHLKQAALN